MIDFIRKNYTVEDCYKNLEVIIMRVCFIIIMSLVSLMNLAQSNASAVLDLEGQYSLEGVWMRNSLLDDDSGKFYFLHQLRLKPEIKVVDALSVYGRFDLLSNPWNQAFKYKGGNFLGSDILDSSQNSFLRPSLDVTHLYFGWSNEFVKLMGGRMPSEFGLGLLFDAGNDPLDHFSDYLDGVGVQFKVGNLEIHPSFGVLREGMNGSADAYEFLIKAQYELADSGLLFGLMYDTRFSTQGGKHLSYGPLIPYSQEHLFFPRSPNTPAPNIPPDLRIGRWGIQTIGTYVKKDLPFGSISLEADFIFSSTIGLSVGGSQSPDGDEALELSGYGVVAEFASHPSSWDWGLKIGYLSGDDPGTDGKYEGFIANRNYNVGMLMFNHAIGYEDTIGGSYRVHPPRNTPQQSQGQINDDRAYLPDVEYLTNALFIAPSLKKSLFSKGYLTTRLLWAKLIQPSMWSENTNLGFEVDVGFMYESSRYLTLAIETGFLFPGGGFVGQSRRMVYGVQASAAVSF